MIDTSDFKNENEIISICKAYYDKGIYKTPYQKMRHFNLKKRK